MRVFIEFVAWCVELKAGATIIGRSSTCDVQLQDDAASRRHVRVVWRPRRSKLTVVDLRSTNGTRLNGGALSRVQRVADGDLLTVGHTLCKLRILEDQDPQTLELEERQRRTLHPNVRNSRSKNTIATCFVCMQPLRDGGDECPNCAAFDRRNRRRDHRVQTTLLVRYASKQRVFTTMTHDLSLGGLFLVSDSPVEPGPCSVMFFPKDAPPVVVQGVGRHVLHARAENGHPPGIGIKFTAMEKRAWLWLQETLARGEDPSNFGEVSQ